MALCFGVGCEQNGKTNDAHDAQPPISDAELFDFVETSMKIVVIEKRSHIDAKQAVEEGDEQAAQAHRDAARQQIEQILQQSSLETTRASYIGKRIENDPAMQIRANNIAEKVVERAKKYHETATLPASGLAATAP